MTNPSLRPVVLQNNLGHGSGLHAAPSEGVGRGAFFVGLGMACATGGLLQRASVRRRAIPGEKAKDFSLPDENGRTLSMESFPGKNILIWWYPEANTHA